MNSKKQIWPTTVDNPFDPFTQWSRWYDFDEKMGYHTCAAVDRICGDTSNLSDAEEDLLLDDAIITLVKFYEPYEVYRIAVEGKSTPFGFVPKSVAQ